MAAETALVQADWPSARRLAHVASVHAHIAPWPQLKHAVVLAAGIPPAAVQGCAAQCHHHSEKFSRRYVP